MIKDYLYRLYDTVSSRGYIEIEYLNFDEMPERQGIVEGRFIFYTVQPSSIPDLSEVLREIERMIFATDE